MTSTPSGRFDRSIVDGPIAPAVWRLAWPTMLQNAFGGLQGIVDHVMVGNFVGFTGNAAIGVSWQIFLVVMVFVSSLFSGMAVLVARFAGADDPEKVNRTVAQAMIMAGVLSVAVLAPIGWFASPWLLELVNAEPAVRAEALPFLRIMFTASLGMMLFFMLGGALRAAGDAQTPLRLGVALTLINIGLNVLLIPGFGPIPRLGTMGAAIGTNLAGTMVSGYAVYRLWKGGWVISVRDTSWRPRLDHHSRAIPVRPSNRCARRCDEYCRRPAPAVSSARSTGVRKHRRRTPSVTQSCSRSSRGRRWGSWARPRHTRARTWARVIPTGPLKVCAWRRASGSACPYSWQSCSSPCAPAAVGGFGMSDPAVVDIGVQLLTFLSVSGLFISVALVHTGGLQGTGDTRGPLYISIVSQIVIPLGICSTLQALRGLQPTDIWSAILVGHATRCLLSVIRFRQGKWRNIRVEIEPART
jgi:Na+-driven multidrug efflux pump